MADMVFRPALNDVDSERAVILEEIAMYEDDPQEKVFDVLGEAVFGDASARPRDHRPRRGGRRDPGVTDRRLPRRALRAGEHRDRRRRRRRPRRARRARRRAHRRRSPGPARPPPAPAAARRGAARRFEHKDTEQYHVCLGGPGISRHDDRRFALRVLDTIFGGTSSSRLFQEVRERRGLAYAVYSFTSPYQDTGQVGLYVGTRADNLGEAVRWSAPSSRACRRTRPRPRSSTRAKENLKGRVLLSLESTGARMNRLGSEVLAGAPLLSLDEVVDRIDAVTHR